MKKVITLTLVTLALTACTGQSSPNNHQAVNIQSLAGKQQIPETSPAAAMAEYPVKGQAIAPTFIGQPPLIPHRDYSITLKRNSCLNCHNPTRAKRMHTTAVPSSHLLADGITLKGQKYFCSQCHVPQASNKQALIPLQN